MDIHLKLFLKWFAILLLFTEWIECGKLKNLLSFSVKKEIVGLENRFQLPDHNIEKVENGQFFFKDDKIPQVETFFSRKVGEYIMKNMEKYDFYGIQDLQPAMGKFNEHLCDILFPKGLQNFTIAAKQSIKDVNIQLEPDQNETIRKLVIRFLMTVNSIFSMYEKNFKTEQSHWHQRIIKQQVQGLILGNEIMKYFLQQHENTFKFVKNLYLDSLTKMKVVRKRIVSFLTDLVQTFDIEQSKDFFSKNIKPILKDLNKKKFKKFSEIKEKAVEVILFFIRYTSNNNISNDEAEKIFGVFLTYPFEYNFLFEWDNLRGKTILTEDLRKIRSFEIKEEKDERNKGKKKEEEEEEKETEPIKNFMISVFVKMNKNIGEMIKEISTFLVNLQKNLELSRVLDSIAEFKTLFSPYVEGSTQNYKIIKVFDIVAKTKSLEPSTSFTEITPQRSFQESERYISFQYLELYYFKIGELRGLFLEFIEYILYRFEKTNPEAANQFPSTRKTAISSAINELLKNSSFALSFLPKDYVLLLRNYMNENERKKSDLIKLIKKKIEMEKRSEE